MEVRGQVLRVGFLLLPCDPQGLNFAHEAWEQVPLFAEPSHWPTKDFF